VREMSRIFDGRPAVVVTREVRKGRRSRAVRELLSRELQSGYHVVLTLPPGSSPSVNGVTVWQRNDLSGRN
jgi:hypothetical protein